MKRKVLSLVICFVLLVSLLPQTVVFASTTIVASGTCGDNLTWALDDEGTLTISGEGEMDYYGKEYPWHSVRGEIKKVIIGSGVVSVQTDAFSGCSVLEVISVDANNQYLSSVDGVLYSNYVTDDLYLVKCPEGYVGTLKIADVVIINTGAVSNCTELNEVIIPVSVLYNEIYSVTGNFNGCTNLTSFDVWGSVPSSYRTYYDTIDGVLYQRSDIGTKLIRCPTGVKGNLKIADVYSIGSHAFYDCDMLTSITIPETLESIENSAFILCDSSFEVYYKGSETTWNEVKIGSNNTALTNATMHFDTVSVKEILLDKTAIVLRKGEMGTIVETISPQNASNKNVLWSSSDVSVAIVENGVVTATGVGDATITATTEDGGYKETCEVTVLPLYSYGQTVQIGLIEPWFLKANARVYTDENPTNIDYSSLVDYGAYFIRKSELSNTSATQASVTVEDIVNDADAVQYSKSGGTATVDGSYITATYDKGLYTYELDDSVFVLFYVQDGAGIQYAPIRERNLKSLCETRMKDAVTFPNELERSVYGAMLAMYNATKAYRDDYYANN